MKHRQPPKVVFVVVTNENGPEYVSRTRKRANERARTVFRHTEVVRYERAVARSRK